MKTNASLIEHYRSYTLKIAEGLKTKEEKKYLTLVPKDPFRNNHHFYIVDGMVTDPENWDDTWFGNYE